MLFEGKNSYDSGLECAKGLLNKQPRPTAIVANNDEMATAITPYDAKTKALKCPEQLSVMRFDDNILASRIIPSLTTIRRPVFNMAHA